MQEEDSRLVPELEATLNHATPLKSFLVVEGVAFRG